MAVTGDEDFQEIITRLDALISILFETGGENGSSLPMVTRIRILHKAGIRPVDISKILGKQTTYINKELSRLRREETG